MYVTPVAKEVNRVDGTNLQNKGVSGAYGIITVSMVWAGGYGAQTHTATVMIWL